MCPIMVQNASQQWQATTDGWMIVVSLYNYPGVEYPNRSILKPFLLVGDGPIWYIYSRITISTYQVLPGTWAHVEEPVRTDGVKAGIDLSKPMVVLPLATRWSLQGCVGIHFHFSRLAQVAGRIGQVPVVDGSVDPIIEVEFFKSLGDHSRAGYYQPLINPAIFISDQGISMIKT